MLAPLLIMGGALGSCFGALVPIGDPALWALLGMAAMMGSTLGAPLTAIVFAVEVTHNLGALLPLAVACVAAHATSVLLLRRSILTEKIARRGHHITREYVVDPFETTRVADSLPIDMPIVEVLAFFTAPQAPRRHKSYPVLDPAGRICGLVARADVLRWTTQGRAVGESLRQRIADPQPLIAYDDELVGTVADRMATQGIGRVPVLRRSDGALVGLVGRRDLLRVRANVVRHEREREAPLRLRRGDGCASRRLSLSPVRPAAFGGPLSGAVAMIRRSAGASEAIACRFQPQSVVHRAFPTGVLAEDQTPSRVATRDARARGNAARYLALDDLETAARQRLPRMIYGFIAGGAETGASVRANRDSFAQHALLPRVLVDTSRRTTAVTLFGRQYAAPFGIAPWGRRRCAPIAVTSSWPAARPWHKSHDPQRHLADPPGGRPPGGRGAAWYQAYLPGDPARIEAQVERATTAGYEVLVLTADVPVPANRENNLRNGFSLPVIPGRGCAGRPSPIPPGLFGTLLRTLALHGMPHFENMDAGRGPPILSRNLVRELGQRDRLTWEHLQLIRRHWRGKLVVKGILSVEDAVRARDCGADGLILSNHGGRQLDGAIAPLQVLPQIAARLPDTAVMLDGGVRRGTDVLKALALGAQFVFLGRPFLYAAALGGAALVRDAALLLTREISRDMALMGLNELGELGAGHVRTAADA